jgi:DNA invertase Pin-like site-specific DNA recombinase
VRRCYVYKYDRVCRTGVRDLLNIIEEFKLAGCELVAVADVVDLTGPASEMILAALAFAAKLERAAINDRIASARERVEAEGGSWGRPRRMNDAAIAKAREMRDQGRTLREIAVAMKVPRSTIGQALSEKVSR